MSGVGWVLATDAAIVCIVVAIPIATAIVYYFRRKRG